MFSWKKTILALVIIANMFNFGLAQSASQNNNTTSSKNTDTATPTASTKGVNPTIGSYGGSNFDKVNLFNGNVSMSFPLASLSSRGGMSAGVVLSYNSKLWYVDKQETRVGGAKNGSNSIAYVPIYNEYDDGQAQLAAGWTIGAGRMRARQSATYLKPAQSICFFDVPAGNVDPKPKTTLTTFSFTAPDGTEYDFRDTIYDGQPRELINCQPVSRGKEFISKDGTSATFISDTEVVDSFFTDQISAPNGPFGYVYLRDGTRFRIEGGLPVEQRDNNGNIVRYEYDGIRLSKVIDNMGREIIVSYGGGALATITIKGFGGANRVTVVKGIKLKNFLPVNEQLKIDQLFPVETVQLSSPNGEFNPKVVTEVMLPDGHKWEFKYNSYGEVVYVKTPARGVVTYEMGPTPNSPKKGGYDEVNNQIFRRVINRQTFPSDIGPVEGKVTYTDPSDPARVDGDGNLAVVEEEVDPSNSDSMITRTRHKFSGHPILGIKGNGVLGTGYRRWLEAKELETEQFNFNGSVMRRSTNLYEQQSGVDWIAGATSTTLEQPENNPRLTKVTSQLLDGGSKTSTVDYTYDEFNNVLTEELKGFDGQVIRKVERTYLRSLNGIDYAGLNRQVAPPSNPNEFDTHLKSLILSESIKNKFNSIESTSTYEYDNYSNDGSHAALDPRSLPANLHDPIYQNTSRVQRGNVTSITRGAGTPEASTIYSQYDVLGNVVAIVGPLANQKTETDYSVDSKFTFPTQTRQFVSGGVSGNRVLTSNRTYDFDTGLVITSTGFNNDTTTFQYNDQLDRLTREIRPVGFGETTYSYSAAGIYPNTVTVQSTLDTTQDLTSISKFDGFLRTIEQRRTDPEGEVVSTTEYDASGRVAKVTNPFREFQSLPTNGYTTTSYDALDRILTVSTFAEDGTFTGTVTTEYETNLVTVTDQAGKKRKSETDAAGRLINVFEPDEQNNLNIVTSYIYDARSNLREVNQGEQTRLFTYDSLSRLLTATSPESGENNGNGVTFYTYDKASNLIERRDPRNLITSYTYDSLNRLATKSYSDGTPSVSYFYDAAPSSLPTGATSPSGFSYQNTLGRATAIASPTTGNNTPTGLFHSYDIGGRITNSSQLLDGQHYTTTSQYNAASLPIGHTYPSGRTISHTFNIAGQITEVDSNNETISDQIFYTPSGSLSEQRLGNGLNHHIAYNSRLQPTSIGLGVTSFSSDYLNLEYDYGLYPISALASVNPMLGLELDQTKNNGNIGRIRIFPGTSPGDSGSAIVQNKNKAKNKTYNLQTNEFFEHGFAYDELNRLKLAKEFAPFSDGQDCFSIVRFEGDGVYEPGTTGHIITVIGTRLTLINQVRVVLPSNISVSIINQSPEALVLSIDTPANAVGSHTIQLISDCASADLTVSVVCLLTNKISEAGDLSIQDGTGFFFTTTTNVASFSPFTTKQTMAGSGTVEIDLTSQHFDASKVPNPKLEIEHELIIPNIAGTSASIDYSLLVNGTLRINDSFSATGNSDGFPFEFTRRRRTTIDLTQFIGNKVIITVNSSGSSSSSVGFFPAISAVTDASSNCAIAQPLNQPIVVKKHKKNNNNKTKSIIQPNPLLEGEYVTSWSQEYDYDRYGNRHTVVGTNAQNLSISTSKNRITDPGYDYDLAGNLIADPSGKQYFYDGENRLIKVAQGDPSNVIAEYFYDGNGWRVKKIANGVTTRFIYDQGGRLLAEYIGEPVPSLDAPTKEHIYGASGMLATVEADKINYHTPDHLGTPRILTDGFGDVISRRDFYPFGDQIIDSVGNRASVFGYSSADSIRQKFTGYERDDESGLDFAQARYFNSSLGRFMSVDPFRGSSRVGNPQTFNSYLYTLNNPINFVDPLGLNAEKKEGFFSKIGSFFKSVGEGIAKRTSSIVTRLIRVEKEPKKVIEEDIQAVVDLAIDYQEYFEDPTSVNDAIKESIEAGNAPDAIADAIGQTIPDLVIGKILPTPPFVYRQGAPSPSNLTPRPTDFGKLSFRDSLSNPHPLLPGQKPVFDFGKDFIKVDTSKLPAGTVIPDNIPPGHVSIQGATPEQIKAAVVDRGKLPKKD